MVEEKLLMPLEVENFYYHQPKAQEVLHIA